MNKVAVLAFLAVLFVASLSFASHPYHVSLAEIERNAETGNLEVSLCVWPADLEKALSQMTDQSIDLDTTENLNELIEKYLNKRLAITSADGQRAGIRYVGHELNMKKGWLYFEVQTGNEPTAWQFENRIFFELNDEQANHCNFKKGREMHSDACTANKPAVEIPN